MQAADEDPVHPDLLRIGTRKSYTGAVKPNKVRRRLDRLNKKRKKKERMAQLIKEFDQKMAS